MSSLISQNPATGAKFGSFPELNSSQVETRILAAKKAFLYWKKLSVEDRNDHFFKLVENLRNQKSKFAELMANEMGKPLLQGEAEVDKCAWVCEYYAQNSHRLLNPRIIETEASQSYICFKPLGIILAIMPWNFPFWQVFRFVAPALISGNVALLKHASNVQGCAAAIEELFQKSNFPENVFQNLCLGSKRIKAVIKNRHIKAVSITGSSAAGKAVAQSAGSVLKKTVLELGGSDPYIILKDADLNSALKACVTGRLINSGQSCISPKRIIIEKPIYAEFERRILKLLKLKKVGDPFKKNVDVGPLVNIKARAELQAQVVQSVKKGAILKLGGQIPDGKGAFYPITLLSRVKPGMAAFDEELFGPVMVLIEAENEQNAVKLANRTRFGLGAAVFTEDIEKGKRIAEEELEAGAAFVNDFVRSDPRLPFGGVKESGYGRELSDFGILEFVNSKTVYIQ
ncbi:MAG: NAD-dependent succinate-semialdehyde dehydrogenase [Candidatus Neomarinimicrobiota bacterium]